MDNDRNGLLVAPPNDENPIILEAVSKGFPLAKVEFFFSQYYEETGLLFQRVEPLLDRLRVDLISGLISGLISAAFEAVSEAVTSLFETAID